MPRTLRYGLIAAAAALLVLTGLVVGLPFIFPTSAWRAEIEAAGSRATGRALMIEGPLRPTFFPVLGLWAGKVTLANVPGGRAPHLAEVSSVELHIRFQPLLKGQIDIAEIVLEAPQIHFEVDKSGEANWTIARPRKGNAGTAHLPANVRIEALIIRDGRLTYTNARNGADRSLNALDADIRELAKNDALATRGTFIEQNIPCSFSGTLSDVGTFFKGEITPITMTVTSPVANSSFSGHFARTGDSDGLLRFDTPSLRRLAELAGHPLSVPGGLGHLGFIAHVSFSPHLVKLANAQLSLDGMTMKGNLAVATPERTPDVTGTIAVDHLDFNPYLGGNAHKPHASHAHEEGWSTKPMRLDALKAVNADLVLDAGSLAVRHLSLGHTHLVLKLDQGLLNAKVDAASLYGGAGTAALTIDTRDAMPRLANRLEFRNIAAQPFLADTLGVTRIEGNATLRLDATSHGTSVDAVMHGLNGTGSITLANGRLRGIDLGSTVHAVESVLRGSVVADTALTSFSTMGGSFTLDRGVLETHDFHLANSVVVAQGTGLVDIGNRTIDFRIEPRAVLQQPDQVDGEERDYGVAVPVHLTGPWNHIHYGANVSNVVTGVLENLEHGRAPFKDLFGHTDSRDNDGHKHKSIGDVIKNMFGIH